MRDRLAVVAFGGGPGPPVLLRGLRQTSGDLITAARHGRGRRRAERPAPRGARIAPATCATAWSKLAGRVAAEVFNHRFEGGVELRDRSAGNIIIIIAALADISGGFREGVEQAGRFLQIKSRGYPTAIERLTLVVHQDDGSVTRGESTVGEGGRSVRWVEIEPPGAAAPVRVIEAIEQEDVVVLAPGGLFTSTIPAPVGAGVPDALAALAGPIVYAASIMTPPGETAGFTLSDHLRAITEHLGSMVTEVLLHSEGLPAHLLSCYCAEGAAPVQIDRDAIERLGVPRSGGSPASCPSSPSARRRARRGRRRRAR